MSLGGGIVMWARKPASMTATRPAFYAARPGSWRDWWTILHPPYTAWHLAYVVIGATLAPVTDGFRLAATVLAFFLAVGIAAHALDELHGRPLHTQVSSSVLVGVAVLALAGAMALGVAGVSRTGAGLLVFIALGPLLVLGYNLELLGGVVHTDLGFAAAWGAFPVLTSYYVQAQRIDVTAVVAAAAATTFSLAQRSLSTQARLVRRRAARVDGAMIMHDGTTNRIDPAMVLAPIERALGWMSVAIVALADRVAARPRLMRGVRAQAERLTRGSPAADARLRMRASCSACSLAAARPGPTAAAASAGSSRTVPSASARHGTATTWRDRLGTTQWYSVPSGTFARRSSRRTSVTSAHG